MIVGNGGFSQVRLVFLDWIQKSGLLSDFKRPFRATE